MVGNQGILKTLEAIIALMLVFFILTILLPPPPVSEPREPSGILQALAEDESFRSCIIARNSTCINQTIDANLDDNFNFALNLSDKPDTAVSGLPDVEIISESVFIAGNVTNTSTRVLRVFYWNR